VGGLFVTETLRQRYLIEQYGIPRSRLSNALAPVSEIIKEIAPLRSFTGGIGTSEISYLFPAYGILTYLVSPKGSKGTEVGSRESALIDVPIEDSVFGALLPGKKSQVRDEEMDGYVAVMIWPGSVGELEKTISRPFKSQEECGEWIHYNGTPKVLEHLPPNERERYQAGDIMWIRFTPRLVEGYRTVHAIDPGFLKDLAAVNMAIPPTLIAYLVSDPRFMRQIGPILSGIAGALQGATATAAEVVNDITPKDLPG